MDQNKNSVLKFFYEICKIPRESGNEKGMQNYLINFAKERNLKYFADNFNNVVIYKDASKDYENSAPIIKKNSSSGYFFLNIPKVS